MKEKEKKKEREREDPADTYDIYEVWATWGTRYSRSQFDRTDAHWTPQNSGCKILPSNLYPPIVFPLLLIVCSTFMQYTMWVKHLDLVCEPFFKVHFILFLVVSIPNVGLKLMIPRSRASCFTDWAHQVPGLWAFFFCNLRDSFLVLHQQAAWHQGITTQLWLE